MTRPPRRANGDLRASRIGASIRALPDLCLGIVSGHLDFPLGVLSCLKPRHARGFLCLTVYRRAPNQAAGAALVNRSRCACKTAL